MLEQTIFLIALGIMAWMDYKMMRISVDLLLITGGAGLLCLWMRKEWDPISLLGGLGIGVLLLLISVITKEQIGRGDGVLFLISGIYLGFWHNLQLLYVSFLIGGACAIVMLILKKRKKADALPFVPFVLAADVLILGVA